MYRLTVTSYTGFNTKILLQAYASFNTHYKPTFILIYLHTALFCRAAFFYNNFWYCLPWSAFLLLKEHSAGQQNPFRQAVRFFASPFCSCCWLFCSLPGSVLFLVGRNTASRKTVEISKRLASLRGDERVHEVIKQWWTKKIATSKFVAEIS